MGKGVERSVGKRKRSGRKRSVRIGNKNYQERGMKQGKDVGDEEKRNVKMGMKKRRTGEEEDENRERSQKKINSIMDIIRSITFCDFFRQCPE